MLQNFAPLLTLLCNCVVESPKGALECRTNAGGQNNCVTEQLPKGDNYMFLEVNITFSRCDLALFRVDSHLYYWLSVFLGIFVPIEDFSLIWKLHHYRWRAANFDQCSVRMVIERWGFFNVPHLLWNGTSMYTVHLRFQHYILK